MRKRVVPLLLAAALLLTAACGGKEKETEQTREQETEQEAAYVYTQLPENYAQPGEKPGEYILAPQLDTSDLGDDLIQYPAVFFGLEPYVTEEDAQSVKRVYEARINAYLEMLEAQGFERFCEIPGYVYNTYYFVKSGSEKETDPEYGRGYDVKVIHYYASDSGDWAEVVIDEDLWRFADLGLRWEGEQQSAVAGPRACDAIVYRLGFYYNESDKELIVRAGQAMEDTYAYTKPFATEAHGYHCYEGLCTALVDGTVYDTTALISDFETFYNDSNDLIMVYSVGEEGYLRITLPKGALETGAVFNLGDFTGETGARFQYYKGEKQLDEENAVALTLRPVWIDRTGASESVVYFYGLFQTAEGETEVEGLMAAPFCKRENCERFCSSSSGSSGGSSVPDSDGPYIPEHSRLDCLTCRGDGDCNSCGGSGQVYFGSTRTTCLTCHGNGNCRACGGSGKR